MKKTETTNPKPNAAKKTETTNPNPKKAEIKRRSKCKLTKKKKADKKQQTQRDQKQRTTPSTLLMNPNLLNHPLA